MDVFFLTDDNGNLFQFDSFGDAPPRYSIANYQKHENNNTYYWRQVGTYISKFLISHKCLFFPTVFLKHYSTDIFICNKILYLRYIFYRNLLFSLFRASYILVAFFYQFRRLTKKL